MGLSVHRSAKYYLIGMFFNLFAPGTVGGDVSRIFYLARDGQEAGAKGRVCDDLARDVSVLVIAPSVCSCWSGWARSGCSVVSRIRGSADGSFCHVLLSGGFFSRRHLLPLANAGVLPEDGHPMVAKFRLALQSYRTRWRASGGAAVVSRRPSNSSLDASRDGPALGLEVPFSFCLIVYPLVGTFAAIPVSFNGIGAARMRLSSLCLA